MKSYEEARDAAVRKLNENRDGIFDFGIECFDAGKSFSDKNHQSILDRQAERHDKIQGEVLDDMMKAKAHILQLEADLSECHKTIGVLGKEDADGVNEYKKALDAISGWNKHCDAQESIIATLEAALNPHTSITRDHALAALKEFRGKK